MFRSATLLIAASLLLGAQYAAATSYLGCISPSSFSSVTPIVALTTTTDAGSTSAGITECMNYCASKSATYAYILSSSTASPNCYCGNTAPAFTAYDKSASTSGTCSTTDYTVHDVTTTFIMQGSGCHNTITFNNPVVQSGISDVQGCFTACATYRVAQVSYASGVYTCTCGSSFNSVGSTAEYCWDTANAWAGYWQHSVVAQASGQARRRLREARNRLEKKSFCPANMNACAIPGSDVSFECIDTLSELESCGGCANGIFGSANSTSGVDCSALPGIALGATTCTLGQCHVSACLPGYKLLNNECVSTQFKPQRPRRKLSLF